MESRSRDVTMNGSIFCVAKLDWQFIGNIRLRGVTPSLRVPRDQQKYPPCLSIRLYLVESLSSLSSTCQMQVSSIPACAGMSRPSRITIPFHTCCQCVPVTLFGLTNAKPQTSICIFLQLCRAMSSGPASVFEFHSRRAEFAAAFFDDSRDSKRKKIDLGVSITSSTYGIWYNPQSRLFICYLFIIHLFHIFWRTALQSIKKYFLFHQKPPK